MYKAALIGYGRAGGRFLRALIHRQRTKKDIILKAVCDYNEERLKELPQYGIHTYTNIYELLKNDDYDIIVVATNEDSHYDILCKINEIAPKCKKILVEKLLVEKIEQAEELKKIFDDKKISVHFVERHSMVLSELKEWMNKNDLTVKRATFSWGKYRLHDYRPTIGVISEISHPLDLILMMANVKEDSPFEILRGNYIFSDYSYSGKQLLDTVNSNILFDNSFLVNANSSFLWNSRMRELLLFLGKDNSEVTHIANITFDNPYWDIDSCIIYDVKKELGKREMIKEIKVDETLIEKNIMCLSKTLKFLEENIMEIKDESYSTNLAHLNHSIYVQKIVEELKKDALKNGSNTSIFNAESSNKERASDCDDLLHKFLEGKINENDNAEWDREY